MPVLERAGCSPLGRILCIESWEPHCCWYLPSVCTKFKIGPEFLWIWFAIVIWFSVAVSVVLVNPCELWNGAFGLCFLSAFCCRVSLVAKAFHMSVLVGTINPFAKWLPPHVSPGLHFGVRSSVQAFISELEQIYKPSCPSSFIPVTASDLQWVEFSWKFEQNFM